MQCRSYNFFKCDFHRFVRIMWTFRMGLKSSTPWMRLRLWPSISNTLKFFIRHDIVGTILVIYNFGHFSGYVTVGFKRSGMSVWPGLIMTWSHWPATSHKDITGIDGYLQVHVQPLLLQRGDAPAMPQAVTVHHFCINTFVTQGCTMSPGRTREYHRPWQ